MKPLHLALLASLLAPAAAAGGDVPLPPPPAGAPLQAADGGPRVHRVAVLAGFLSLDSVASPSVQLDFARVATPAGWTRAELEWHLGVQVGRPSWREDLLRTVAIPVAYGGGSTVEPVGTTHDTVWVADVIPSARVVFPVARAFSLHVEAGFGLSQTVERHVEDQVFVGHTEGRKLVLAPAFRAALGLSYRIGDRLDLVMQPVALGRRIGTSDSSFSALWGVAYRP